MSHTGLHRIFVNQSGSSIWVLLPGKEHPLKDQSHLCVSFTSLREVTVTRTETISDGWCACYVPGNGINILSLPPHIASPGLKYKGQRGNIWTFAEVQLHGTWQRPDLEHSVLFPRPVSTRPTPGFWLLPRFHYTDSIGQDFTALRDHNLICTHP